MHSNSSGLKNLNALDGFRGLAILLVVIGHFWRFSSEGNNIPVKIGNYDITNLFLLAGHGVQMFFVMSAFLLYLPFACDPQNTAELKKKFILNFYKRRLIRIYPAFFIFSLVLLALTIFDIYSQVNFKNFIANIFFLQQIGVGAGVDKIHPDYLPGTWSLVVEICFYSVLPLIVFLRSSKWLVSIICITSIAIGMLYRVFYLAIFGEVQLSAEQSFVASLNLVSFLDSFAFGILGAQIYAWIEGKGQYVHRMAMWSFSLISIAGLICIYIEPTHPYPLRWSWLSLIDHKFVLGFISACLIISITLKNSYLEKLFSYTPLRIVGIVSFSLFLTHSLVWHLLAYPLFRIFNVTNIHEKLWIGVLVVTPICIFLSVIFYLFIELPFLRKGSLIANIKISIMSLKEAILNIQINKLLFSLLAIYALFLTINFFNASNPLVELRWFQAASLTDINWDAGVARDNSRLLIRAEDNPGLIKYLQTSRKLITEQGKTYEVTDVKVVDKQWVHVYIQNIDPLDFKSQQKFMPLFN